MNNQNLLRTSRLLMAGCVLFLRAGNLFILMDLVSFEYNFDGRLIYKKKSSLITCEMHWCGILIEIEGRII